MSSNVKVKETNKDIKVLDKSAIVSQHIRETFIRTKSCANQERDSENNHSETQYAQDKIAIALNRTAQGSLNQIEKTGKNAYKLIKEKNRAIKVEKIVDSVGENIVPINNSIHQQRPVALKNTFYKPLPQNIRVVRPVDKTIKQSLRSIQRSKINATTINASNNISGSINQTKRIIKVRSKAKKTEKHIQKNAQRTVQISKHTARATVKSIEKAAITTAKAARNLISIIASGGWIILLILIIVVIFGGALSNVGGGEVSAASPVSKEVESYEPLIEKYAAQHGIQDFVELIKAVMMQESGGRGNDPMQASECAFNVRYPNTPNGITNPVYSINVGVQNLAACLKEAGAKSPFDLKKVKLALQGYNYGNGYISWAKKRGGYTEKNAVEFSSMMAQRLGWKSYGDVEYVPHVLRYYPFDQILPGVGIGNQGIVKIALQQEGNIGGQKFWSWYGFNSRVEWCACFVSWCADQCGYIKSGIFPKFASCMEGAAWFKKNNQWKGRNYSPKAGDVIFFDWDGNGRIDHVGIVVNTVKGVVNTIEGNSRNACKRRSYNTGNSWITGYGIPRY